MDEIKIVNSDPYMPQGPMHSDAYDDLMDRLDAVNALILEEENRHEDEIGILLNEKEEIERDLGIWIDGGYDEAI